MKVLVMIIVWIGLAAQARAEGHLASGLLNASLGDIFECNAINLSVDDVSLILTIRASDGSTIAGGSGGPPLPPGQTRSLTASPLFARAGAYCQVSFVPDTAWLGGNLTVRRAGPWRQTASSLPLGRDEAPPPSEPFTLTRSVVVFADKVECFSNEPYVAYINLNIGQLGSASYSLPTDTLLLGGTFEGPATISYTFPVSGGSTFSITPLGGAAGIIGLRTTPSAAAFCDRVP